jgi:type IV secretory pathway ATPase VirB11/archaellum biosynthesis ATPase
MQTISEAAAYTLQFINQTQRSVFLTGKAGTGKTAQNAQKTPTTSRIR